jgi:DNA polymerase-3 subunit delta
MDSRAALKEMKQTNPRPIYVLHGSESFLMDEFLQYAKNQLLDENAIDFNFQAFDLNEVPIQQVIQEAETLPFIGDRRVVIGTNALFLTSAKVSGGPDHELGALQSYIDNPSDTCVLFLMIDQEKLDERKKIVKSLRELGVVFSFLPLKDIELVGWMKRKAQQVEATLEDETARLLHQFVGNDLRRLQQEINKLSTYVGRNGQITTEAVTQLTSRSLEQDIFHLIAKVISSEVDAALRMYFDLLKSKDEPTRNREQQRGKDPLAILSLLARQFRIILQVKVLMNKGYSQQQIASTLGIHPYPVKLAAEQSQRVSESALRQILVYLSEEDYRIKTGKVDKVLSLELFIIKVKDIIRAS